MSFDLPVEDFLFSVGGEFLFAVVVGLFVAGLAYLSYEGWLDVKWMELENASRTTLTSVVGQAVHALNNTASQFATDSSTIQIQDHP